MCLQCQCMITWLCCTQLAAVLQESPQDTDQELHQNAAQLRRIAATQTDVGIASTAFGPLTVSASAAAEAR